MRILLSNDDGVHARGIQVLYRELSRIAQVTVVAPLEERSTTGHSLTLHKPLRLVRIDGDFHGVSGSPADCVYLGIRKLFGSPPDLVVSGINRGANLGQDVHYSGTVSAAREACVLGIPSLAVSLDVDFHRAPPDSELHYTSAAKLAVRVIRRIFFSKRAIPVPRHTLLNLNVPDAPLSQIRGIETAWQGFRFYSGRILQRKDHRGRDYYWVGGNYRGFRREAGTDCDLVARGVASLTPLKLDSTDHDFLEKLGVVWPSRSRERK